MKKSRKTRSAEQNSQRADAEASNLKNKAAAPQDKVFLTRVILAWLTGREIPGTKNAAGFKGTIKKRRRQYRYLSTLLRVAIRLLNASGRKTIRVK